MRCLMQHLLRFRHAGMGNIMWLSSLVVLVTWPVMAAWLSANPALLVAHCLLDPPTCQTSFRLPLHMLYNSGLQPLSTRQTGQQLSSLWRPGDGGGCGVSARWLRAPALCSEVMASLTSQSPDITQNVERVKTLKINHVHWITANKLRFHQLSEKPPKAKASIRRHCPPAVAAALCGMPAFSSDVTSNLHSVCIPMASACVWLPLHIGVMCCWDGVHHG